MTDTAPLILHASAVAIAGKALLIRGASGSGKSSLALELMALGAGLVSDDRTVVEREGDALWLSAPETIRGMIEARGLGLLAAEPILRAPLAAVVDLDHEESERLPPHRQVEISGVSVPLLHAVARGSFPAALRQYLLCGRIF
jgi:HPr kinase/phosphorylase